MTRRLTPVIVLVVAVVAAAVAASMLVLATRPSVKHLAAEFPNTTNLYPGAQVKVLGVTIGSVDSVEVHGTTVRVDMSYDSSRSLPAEVHALIVPPSIVGDRFVQLAPPYTGGPTLSDGAVLDSAHTEVPVELEQAYQALDTLATSLGPNGANAHGALSRLITNTAANLRGNGDAVHQAVQELSRAADTLGNGREDLAGTVTNLGNITATLASADTQVRALVSNLATVSRELNGQRDELAGAATNLNQALADIARFVHDNRDALTTNINGVADVAATVAAHQRDLAEILDTLPLGATNLYDLILPINYDPAHPESVPAPARATATVSRFGGLMPNLPVQLAYLFTAACGQLPATQQHQLGPICTTLQRTGGDIGQALNHAANPLLGPGLGTTGQTGPNTLPGLLLGGQR